MKPLIQLIEDRCRYSRLQTVSIQTCASPDDFCFGIDPPGGISYENVKIQSTYSQNLEAGSKATLVAAPFFSSFDPLNLTTLDLSSLEEGMGHIFETGELPRWICNFQNLQTLNVAKTGLVILQPWLVSLAELSTLHLEHNFINTWPWFLRDLPKLRAINLDGNPCLEKAFLKSPTLRSWFFSWDASSEICKSVPSYIRGEEWPPASSVRISNHHIMNGLGYFCGGIYLLTSKEDTSNDGLLTRLEPDPLFTRLYSANFNSQSEAQFDQKVMLETTLTCSPAHSNSSKVYIYSPKMNSPCLHLDTGPARIQADGFNIKHGQLLEEIFDDIQTLRERDRAPQPSVENPHVLLVGSPSDLVNRLIYSKSSIGQQFTAQELFYFASLMVREEEAYILELEFVCKHFYLARLKSSEICHQLRIVFTAFPAMLSIHKKSILPSLKAFEKALSKLAQLETSRAGWGPEANKSYRGSFEVTSQMTANLSTAFRRLHLALESYLKNIWRAEFLLDVASAATRLYICEEFFEHVSSRLKKLNGLGGNSGVNVNSPTLFSTEGFNFATFASSKETPSSPNSSSDPKMKTINNPQPSWHQWIKPRSLKQWVNEELCKRNPSIKRNPADFIYMPLVRLTRYERFFTSLSRNNHSYDTLVRFFRGMRRLAASKIQIARRKARCEILSAKLKVTPQFFEQYKWDAVVTVRSRGYFENGLLSKNTMDVLDIGDRPVSFVKEVFHRSKERILRIVYCGNEIMLWDEIFEQFIGRIKKNMLIALPAGTKAHPMDVRIVFVDARETCLVEVKDFRAKYTTRLDAREEFLEACQYDCKLVL